tara:strand:+ start:284 stop:1474 length:1191 start_codon:yes stop_codon:yes gene_type:complete
MASGTIASVLRLGLKISKKSSGTMKGVTKSSKKFDKAAKKGLRIKQRLRIAEMKYDRKRRLDKKRKEQEAELEQQKSQRSKKSSGGIKAVGQNMLERLMSVVSLLIVGFILNKLPKIIEKVKSVIDTINNIVDKVKAFFSGIKSFFDSIGKVVSNVISMITSIDLNGFKDRVSESLSQIKNVLGGLAGSFLDGAKEMFKFGKKEEQEFAAEESEKNSEGENEEDNQIKTSVGDAKKTLSSQTNSFNQSLKTMEKEGTGANLIPPEDSNLLKENKLKMDESDKDGEKIKSKDDGLGSVNSTKSVTDEETKPEGGGTADIKPGSNEQKPQIGDKLNISKTKTEVNTNNITPERKSKNTVVIIGGNNSSQVSPSQNSQDVVFVENQSSSLKDKATLTLY